MSLCNIAKPRTNEEDAIKTARLEQERYRSELAKQHRNIERNHYWRCIP